MDKQHRQGVRGIVKDSAVLCTQTGAADVYVHVITQKETGELYKGDGTVIPPMT